MKSRSGKSKHHLTPRSRGGSNHPDNVHLWDEEYHADWHRVFSNMTPAEQIAHVVNLNSSVIKQEFLELFALLLSVSEEEMYQPQCVANVKKMQSKSHDSILLLLNSAGVDL